MRVLAVGNMYPPHHLGGYELVWQGAVRHLRALGHEARVLTTDHREEGVDDGNEPDVHRELRWWWRDHDFPQRAVRERFGIERHNSRVLERHLAELRPDVVAWWSMGGMSLSLIERVRRRALPAVAFVHDDWLVYGPKVDAWMRLWRGRGPGRVRFSRAARYLFVSEATRARAVRARGELASTGIAHSGIDATYVDPQPARPWEWTLLYVGRVDLRKGLDTAVEALGLLPAPATLTIVGGGDPAARAALRERASALSVAERITMAGPRSRAELREFYVAADAVVFPVVWDEPWGLVPIEAMALGRPVVATGRGGSGEYLRDGENALLFEAGDARALGRAIERLAADSGLRARLVAGGTATAPAYTETVFNAAVVDALEQAARGR
jgi:glycogen(starch) synthase